MARKQKHIVILGGGFGGVECFRRLQKFDREDIRVTLINKHNYSLFTPMLHEVATGSVSRKNIVQPLREMIACCHNRFIEAEVTEIRLQEKIVKTSVKDVHFDYLVIALGWVSNFFSVAGAEKYAFALKDMGHAVTLRNHLIRQFETGATTQDMQERDDRLRFAIVGGGLTGVEMAGQLADFCKEMYQLYPEIPEKEPEIVLVHAGDRILPQLAPISSATALRVLKKKKVKVLLNTRATSVEHNHVVLSDNQTIKTYTTIWTSGGKSLLPNLVKEKETLDTKGQLITQNTLTVEGFPYVFGVGDCIECTPARPPSTAQAATQAGMCAAHNILSSIDGRQLDMFTFKSKGDLVPIGDWFAVGEIGRFVFSGKIAWWMRRTVFIHRLWGWVNRLKVTIEWTINIIHPRDTSQF